MGLLSNIGNMFKWAMQPEVMSDYRQPRVLVDPDRNWQAEAVIKKAVRRPAPTQVATAGGGSTRRPATRSTRTSTRKTAGTSKPNQTNNQINSQLTNLNRQIEPLYSKYINELKDKTGRARAEAEVTFKQNWDKLQKDYWGSAESNDKNFGTGVRNAASGYAARGLGDSSYLQNAQGDLRSRFFDVYGKLNNERTTGQNQLSQWKNKAMTDLQGQFDDGMNSINALRHNYYNPQNPQFTDLNQIVQAKANLLNQMQTIPNMVAPQAPQVNWNFPIGDYVNQFTQGNQAPQGLIPGNYSKDEWNKYLYGA